MKNTEKTMAGTKNKSTNTVNVNGFKNNDFNSLFNNENIFSHSFNFHKKKLRRS